MAVEKGKVTSVLEARFKGKLTKNFIDKLAEKWAPKIDTDGDIDKYVEDREDIIQETISEADRRATNAAAKARTDAAAAVAGKTDAKTDDPTEPAAPAVPDGAPDWFKTFLTAQQAQMQQLTTAISGIQQQKQAETIADRFKKDERLKDIPEAFFKGRVPAKDEDFEAAVTELAADWRPLAEKFKTTGFGGEGPTARATGSALPTGGKVTEASDAEVDAVMKML